MDDNKKFAFNKNNYILLGIGVLLIIIGLFLMQGGGSEEPNIHNVDEMFGLGTPEDLNNFIQKIK